MRKGYYFSELSKQYELISKFCKEIATGLINDGYIPVSTRYRQVARPRGDYSKYGYEWHARCDGEVMELDAETFTAFKELSASYVRCGECGLIYGHGNNHGPGCQWRTSDLEAENQRLRAKLAEAMAEIASLKNF